VVDQQKESTFLNEELEGNAEHFNCRKRRENSPVNVQSCGLMLNRLRRLCLLLLLQEVFKVHWDMFYELEKRRHKVKK